MKFRLDEPLLFTSYWAFSVYGCRNATQVFLTWNETPSVHYSVTLPWLKVNDGNEIYKTKLWRVNTEYQTQPGFRRTFRFTARKTAGKVCFYNPCTSGASESEFDHAKRLLSLKMDAGALVKKVRLPMSRLSIHRSVAERLGFWAGTMYHGQTSSSKHE